MAARTKRERLMRLPLGRRDDAAGRAHAANMVLLDLWPACPRCGDLHSPGTVVCTTCGARLTVRLPL